MDYYISTRTGKVITLTDVSAFDKVIGGDNLPYLISNGILKKMENPTVVDILRRGDFTRAVQRYRELHEGCDFKHALFMTRKIEGDMLGRQIRKLESDNQSK